MNGILGKKLGMTQIFDANGLAIPVTVVLAGPCLVSQLKTKATDGYSAVQLAFDQVTKEISHRKPAAGHFKDTEWRGARFIREFRIEEGEAAPERGSFVNVEFFSQGEVDKEGAFKPFLVEVSGVSKGKGFLGVVGRHSFHGGPQSHGSMSHRRPGSIGAAAQPGHVIKGMRMGGQTGNKIATTLGLTVAKIDTERNLLLIRGAVPGSVGTYLYIRKQEK